VKEVASLKEALYRKEEEQRVAVLGLKEENGRLLRQLKSGQKAAGGDRELARLTVENELLRKQLEEIRSQGASLADSSNNSIQRQSEIVSTLKKPAASSAVSANIDEEG
jgi:hypothetical protein